MSIKFSMLFLLAALLVTGCPPGDDVVATGDDDDATGDDAIGEDADGDGFTVEEGDCDDTLSALNPAATDIVGDDIDQNCDGVDGTDNDGDGAASTASGGDDCNDDDATVGPGADEVVDDEIDQDCDGQDASSYIGGWTVRRCSPDPVPTGEDVGDITEDFVAIDQFGDTFTLSDFCNKVIVIHVDIAGNGATFPVAETLQDYFEAYGDQGLMVVTAFFSGGVEGIAGLVTSPVLDDADGELPARWGVNGVPSITVLAPGMEIVQLDGGTPSAEMIEALLPLP